LFPGSEGLQQAGFIIALATSLGTALGVSAGSASVGVGAGIAGSLGVVGTTNYAAIVGGAILGVGAAGVAGAATAGVMGTVSSVQQAQQQQANAEYQAQIEAKNMELASREIDQINEQGQFEMRQQKLRQQAQISEGQVAGAAGGVQLGSGSLLEWEMSAQEVFNEDNSQLQYDIDNRKYQARIGLWNSSNSKALSESRSNAYSSQIPMLAVGGTINTIANTASSALSLGSGLLKLHEQGTMLKSTFA